MKPKKPPFAAKRVYPMFSDRVILEWAPAEVNCEGFFLLTVERERLKPASGLLLQSSLESAHEKRGRSLFRVVHSHFGAQERRPDASNIQALRAFGDNLGMTF